jgi:phosphate transport system ATP-binding protein
VVDDAIAVRGLHASYGSQVALRRLDLAATRNTILAIIGPARSGKSTLLSVLNRTLEHVPQARWSGEVCLHGAPIAGLDPTALRRRVAMVLPLPVGLPLSIRDNVTLAPRMSGVRDRTRLAEIVETSLRRAALWDEVKDRLDELGTRLSGGQQQRLTLARALSTAPEVLCLDEFSIAIDPITTARIEEALAELRGSMTIILVTNLLGQARRTADRTAFLLDGELIEEGPTPELFADPRDPRTRDYLAGRFG